MTNKKHFEAMRDALMHRLHSQQREMGQRRELEVALMNGFLSQLPSALRVSYESTMVLVDQLPLQKRWLLYGHFLRSLRQQAGGLQQLLARPLLYELNTTYGLADLNKELEQILDFQAKDCPVIAVVAIKAVGQLRSLAHRALYPGRASSPSPALLCRGTPRLLPVPAIDLTPAYQGVFTAVQLVIDSMNRFVWLNLLIRICNWLHLSDASRALVKRRESIRQGRQTFLTDYKAKLVDRQQSSDKPPVHVLAAVVHNQERSGLGKRIGVFSPAQRHSLLKQERTALASRDGNTVGSRPPVARQLF
jgi:hypothetical protein